MDTKIRLDMQAYHLTTLDWAIFGHDSRRQVPNYEFVRYILSIVNNFNVIGEKKVR